MISGEEKSASPCVLTFHKLSKYFSFGSTNYTPARFERLLEILQKKGYSFVSLKEALDMKQSSKVVAITFDDGYQHLVQSLPPLIKKYDIIPTIFMPSDLIGETNRWDYSSVFRIEPHLNETEIKMLSGLGVEFGSHSETHADLTLLDQEQLDRELQESRQKLSAILGNEIQFCAYPFGRNNQLVRKRAAKAGYQACFTMEFPEPTDDSFALGRIPVNGYDTPFSILRKIEPGLFHSLEKLKSKLTNRLSSGTEIYRRLSHKPEKLHHH